jgi:hypothetical protein
MNLEIKLEKGDSAKDDERGKEFFTVKEIPALSHSEITFNNLVILGQFILSESADKEKIVLLFNPTPTADEQPYSDTIKNLVSGICGDSELQQLYSQKAIPAKSAE